MSDGRRQTESLQTVFTKIRLLWIGSTICAVLHSDSFTIFDMGPGTRYIQYQWVPTSYSFTIFGLWVLGLAVSNINESQLQTYES